LQTLTINVDFCSYSGYIQTVLSFNVANALLSSSTGDTSNCTRNPIDLGRPNLL